MSTSKRIIALMNAMSVLKRRLVDADALRRHVLLELLDHGVGDGPAGRDFVRGRRLGGRPLVAFLRELLGEADERAAAVEQARETGSD